MPSSPLESREGQEGESEKNEKARDSFAVEIDVGVIENGFAEPPVEPKNFGGMIEVKIAQNDRKTS